MTEASMMGAALKAPYVLKVTNKSKYPKDVILFGSNRNCLKPNYGNDSDIEVENDVGYPENDYGQLLMQIWREPVEVALIRLQTMNFENFEKANKALIIHVTDAAGYEYTNPLPFHKIIEKNDERLQRGILDVRFLIDYLEKLIIDGKLQIELELEPKSQMTIHIFPK